MAPIAAPMFMCTCVYIQILENNTKCHMAATLGADDPEHWRIELLNQRYFVRLCPSAPCFLGLLKDLPKAGCLFVKRKDVSSDKGIQIGSHRKPKSIEFPVTGTTRRESSSCSRSVFRGVSSASGLFFHSSSQPGIPFTQSLEMASARCFWM